MHYSVKIVTPNEAYSRMEGIGAKEMSKYLALYNDAEISLVVEQGADDVNTGYDKNMLLLTKNQLSEEKNSCPSKRVRCPKGL